ncbi:chromatin protein [Aphelenchoides avenae]|nr:chromatin protein [Aphelenchus avenae]
MSSRTKGASSQIASDNVIRRSAKPNVFKSLNWKKELDRVLKKNAVRIPAAVTRQEITRRFAAKADCEMLTPETISLKCPISKKRIQVAAKGVNCRHMQCFDLSAFIQVRACSNRWYCPLCETETKLDQLRIIEFVNAILQATDSNVELVELVGDGSIRPVAQVEIDPNVKINDELPYVPDPEDVKPDVADVGLASKSMNVEREPLMASAMTASSEREDASFLEDVKPPKLMQPAQSDNVKPEVLNWYITRSNERVKVITSDDAQDSVLEDVKSVIARGATSSTSGTSEQRTDLEEEDNLKLQMEASNAEVQRVSLELRTERAARLDLELKVSQLRKDLDDMKARFDELPQKRMRRNHGNAAQLKVGFLIKAAS